MSFDSLSFASLSPMFFMFVMTTDGTLMPLANVGYVITSFLSLSNVYHILNLIFNLIFVGQSCDFGYSIFFSSIFYFVQDP